MKNSDNQISKNNASYIEEYKEIRAEIRHYLERRSKSTHFALIITAAVVGVPEELRSGFLFLITSMIIGFIWYDETRRIMAVFRLATYLEVFVEPNVIGLNWETYGGLHSIHESLFDRLLSNGVFPLAFLIHSITSLYVFEWILFWKIILTFFIIVIFLYLIKKSYSSAKHGRISELNAWKKILNNSN